MMEYGGQVIIIFTESTYIRIIYLMLLVIRIDWERGNPYVWKMEDLQYLLETEHLFARKFDSQNMDVVIKIRELFS